jgi:hypothetical protein
MMDVEIVLSRTADLNYPPVRQRVAVVSTDPGHDVDP